MSDSSTHNALSAERARLGDLYRRYWPDLCRFLAKRFGSGPPEPEDVAQAAFARFAALEDPGAVRNPKAFLFRTASNIAIDHRRSAKRQAAYASEVAAGGAQEIRDDLTPEIVLSSKDEFEIVKEAIKNLPRRHRAFLLLHRLEGLSYSEIARRSGMSRSGVQKIVDQALARCLAALKTDARDRGRRS